MWSVVSCSKSDDDIDMSAINFSNIEDLYSIINVSDMQITLNLAKNGEFDPKLLIGEWDFIKFAYTADGKEITDVAEKPYPNSDLLIFGPTNELEKPIQSWLFGCSSQWRVYYEIFPPNLIKLSPSQTQFDNYSSPEDDAMVSVLNNAYSFVIKDDELIIYFTRYKNLLISKKIKL